jgi:hypothetical protein
MGKISCEANEDNSDKQVRVAEDSNSISNKLKLRHSHLRFSKDIEQEYVIDREYLSLDAGRDLNDSPRPLGACVAKNSPTDVTSLSLVATERDDCCQDRDMTSEQKKIGKTYNQGHGESAEFSKAWERSNFMESAPDFGMDRLFNGLDSSGRASHGS